MFFYTPYLLTLVLSIGPYVTDATPVPGAASVRMPAVYIRGNSTANAQHVIDKDSARIERYKGNSGSVKIPGKKRRNFNAAPVNNGDGYYINVQFGKTTSGGGPPLQVDTGSSYTWVSTGGYKVNKSAADKRGFYAAYGDGSNYATGKEYIDTMTIGTSGVSCKQTFGLGTSGPAVQDGWGIFGVGPTDLSEYVTGPLTGPNAGYTDSTPVNTPVDNLMAQGVISSRVLGISFSPVGNDATGKALSGAGELSFGAIDSSKFTTGSMNYVPITSHSPSSGFWGVDASITYGNTSTSMTTLTAGATGIVDTGTTLVYLPSDAFSAYQAQTGAILDSSSGFYKVTPAQFAKFKNLTFNINGKPYSMTPDAQRIPQSQTQSWGLSTSSVWLMVNNFGSPSGEGMDFIIGYQFLMFSYSVFDTDNKRIGLAPTSWTNSVVS